MKAVVLFGYLLGIALPVLETMRRGFAHWLVNSTTMGPMSRRDLAHRTDLSGRFEPFPQRRPAPRTIGHRRRRDAGEHVIRSRKTRWGQLRSFALPPASLMLGVRHRSTKKRRATRAFLRHFSEVLLPTRTCQIAVQ